MQDNLELTALILVPHDLDSKPDYPIAVFSEVGQIISPHL